MAANTTRKSPIRGLPPGPAPGALGKRRAMTFRIPEATLDAFAKEARRRNVRCSALVVEILMNAEKRFASAKR